MGEAKRRRDMGFVKPSTPRQVDGGVVCEKLIDGTQILVAIPVNHLSKGAGDAITYIDFDELYGNFSHLKSIVDYAYHPDNIRIAKQRQFTEGKGLLTLTPKSYRELWGVSDESEGNIVFNWWSLNELKAAQARCYIFGGTRIIKSLAEPLILGAKNRFPVILHAVPAKDDSSEQSHTHLMFTVPLDEKQAVEHPNVHLLERHIKPLA